MNYFTPGDRVVTVPIQGELIRAAIIGLRGVVVRRRDDNFQPPLPAPERFQPVEYYLVLFDNIPDGYKRNLLSCAHVALRLEDPPGNWDDCVWQPQRDTA